MSVNRSTFGAPAVQPRLAGRGVLGLRWPSQFSALNDERVYRTVSATKAQARCDVVASMEDLCNPRRRAPTATGRS